MREREKLIGIVDNYEFDCTRCNLCDRPDSDCAKCGSEVLSDYLLENGIIVPPCKVGDKVYALWETSADLHICPSVVTEIRTIKRNCRQVNVLLLERMDYSGRKREYSFEEFGKTVFLTREEAEKALKERV